MHPVTLNIHKKSFILTFAFDPVLIEMVRNIPLRKWNPAKKQWEFPITYNVWLEIGKTFGDFLKLSPSALIYPLAKDLSIQNYSQKTIRSYSYHARKFFLHAKKQPSEIQNSDIISFLDDLKCNQHLSSASLRQAIGAIKYYFANIHKKDLAFYFPTIRKEKILPEILSEKEVSSLIFITKNCKHNLLLKLAYSSGLRVSELVRLKWSDIDLDRNILRVRQGKGKKDRHTLLSKKMRDWLEDYKKSNMFVEENFFLFPGAQGLNHLSERTAQKIFENSLSKTQIQKKLSIHSLRHAFATHMLEQGTDIRYIQMLLGHRSLKTTQIYTRVAKTSIQNLTSPIDNIPL